MFSKHPNAKNSRFPPLCPVYICDTDENPPGIDAQGVVVEVGLEASSKVLDSFDTVYKVAVKCKNERGDLFRREEIVRPERLIFKNNCNVYLKVPNATTDDNTSPAKREAVVTGFHMLSCNRSTSTKDRNYVRELRYIVQEVDGKKVVHNRVHPELVSFRHVQVDEAKHDVAIGSNAKDPNVVTATIRTSHNEMDSEVKKHQQIPNCINVTDRKQYEISSTTLEEVPSQRNDFQMQQPHRQEVKHIIHSSTDKNTDFGANITRVVKAEQIEIEGDRPSMGQKRKHNTSETRDRISNKKVSNPVPSTHESNVSNSSSRNQAPNTSRSTPSTPSIVPSTNHGSEIDVPLKSACSLKIGREHVKRDDVSVNKSNASKSRIATRKKEYMYQINLDSFDHYELEDHLIGNHSSKYKSIIKDTNCNSFHIDEHTPSLQIFADDPSDVEKGVRYIIKVLGDRARYGRKRLQNFIVQRDKIVETFIRTKNDDTTLNRREATNLHGSSNRSPRDETKTAHRNERQSYTSRLILPMRRVTAYDLLVGNGGVTHKALMQITKCHFSLKCHGNEDSCITITGGSRSILDRGIDIIFDTLAKEGIRRRQLDQIEIIDELEAHPKKIPRRR